MRSLHVLVIGGGSAGQRHLRNFAALGCRVSVADPRPDRLVESSRAAPLVHSVSDWGAALDADRYDGVVVASPPAFHVQQAHAAIERRLPVFLEKPAGVDLDSVASLSDAAAAARIPVLLGYTYRWWPPLRELRERVQRHEIGRVLHVRGVMAAHLADWHPWEHYQDFFMARRELGGGALLDESHLLDLLHWLLGPPVRVAGAVEKVSNLEIDADDHVDARLEYASGARALVHLDLYTRPHEKSLRVVGDQGTLLWTWEPNRLALARDCTGEFRPIEFLCERNEMFVAAAREFLAVVRDGAPPSCTLADGCAVMRVIAALRTSAATGQTIALE
ncbi:MAG: Gfo/Idh/MocA family protein [Phycisphaerae bacterium]